MLASLKKKETYTRYFKSFKFAFYCMTHPLDGYWDLTHEKRGSLAVANTILILTLVARIASLQFTSFIFNQVYWPEVNIFLYLGSIVFPLALWVVGNWALTTLFDGKARLPQIYMATCYAMLPYPLFQFPLIIFSNVVTVNEAEFYTLINTIVLVFCAIYIVVAMMQIHEYTMSKTILFTAFSIFAMLVIVFILLLFFSMISQGIAYFVSIVREILFRI
ncbi:MAG: YIP1 family protein [Lachnospiraceae bacterium]|nr:YIP1 family protein [Lachnospiraceae bacterium]MBQ8633991.1 YIP1 family protein [Lachnospiraceae bacterium]